LRGAADDDLRTAARNHHRRSEKKVRRQLDFAYACFALMGFTMLAIVAEPFFVDLKSPGAGAGYGFAVGMGLGLPSMLALVLAICLTVMRRRYQPIVIFCMLNVLLLSMAIVWENDSIRWIYGTVSMLVPAWWFIVGRWRNTDKPLSQS
jgi:hypothetical protein